MKTKFTAKQAAFIANKRAGVPNREAAESAGFSARTADVIAANLLKRPDIREAIKGVEVGSRLRARYDSPKDLLADVMNSAAFPDAARIDAARQLLPYFHARIGEQGKKDKAKDAAHAAVSRRTPLGLPGLAIVK